MVLCLFGCEKSTQAIDALNKKIDQREESFIARREQALRDGVKAHTAIITDDAVIFHKKHLAFVKTLRFQPSFSLEGSVAPIKSTDITSKTDAKVQAIFAKSGATVRKDQLLAIVQTAADESPNTKKIVRITAPFRGVIGDIHASVGESVAAGTPIMVLTDVSKYQFISHLPSHLKPHIHIGDSVELTIDGKAVGGQVLGVANSPTDMDTLDVYVGILPQKEVQKPILGQSAKGVIEHGQIEVGALVPDFAIVGDAMQPLDLSALYAPPYKPSAPIAAHVWTVKQNSQLQLSPIHVIEYLPNTRRFLVSGITEDSLIVLTNLPKSANQKHAIIR